MGKYKYVLLIILCLLILSLLLTFCISQLRHILQKAVNIYVEYGKKLRAFPPSGEYGNNLGFQIVISNDVGERELIRYPDGTTEPYSLSMGNRLLGEYSRFLGYWYWDQKENSLEIEIVRGNTYLTEGEKYILYPISESE